MNFKYYLTQSERENVFYRFLVKNTFISEDEAINGHMEAYYDFRKNTVRFLVLDDYTFEVSLEESKKFVARIVFNSLQDLKEKDYYDL